MSRLAVLMSLVLVTSCSELTEGTGGVVELEVQVPAVPTVEVGEALQLSARALDRDGNAIAVPITWRSSDPLLAVDDAGLVTGVAPGSAEVQAFAGSLASQRIPLTVIARADTLVLAGDSVVIVAPEATASAPLVVQLLSFSQPDPLAARPVVYTLTSPPDVGPHSVEFPGGVLVDTISTDGSQGLPLNRVPGIASPDTAFVQVRSYRASGADVPGSGQRFLVIFQ
ncbi:MAG TPA: Ig-like domain-containing protein [Gemmatimonadales bacterium]|nr:Ig-like domain-containing protein [Gemmatimonadales bacterium]